MAVIRIQRIFRKDRCKIEKYILKTLKDLRINKNIKRLDVLLDKKLKDDVQIDFKQIKKGYVKLKVGKNKIDKKIIYHEFGHVYDAIYNNISFYNYKISPKKDLLCGLILNISLDGRLEKLGFPHISKKERLSHLRIFMRLWNNKYKEKFTKKELIALFEKYWGREFHSSKEILDIYEKIRKG